MAYPLMIPVFLSQVLHLRSCPTNLLAYNHLILVFSDSRLCITAFRPAVHVTWFSQFLFSTHLTLLPSLLFTHHCVIVSPIFLFEYGSLLLVSIMLYTPPFVDGSCQTPCFEAPDMSEFPSSFFGLPISPPCNICTLPCPSPRYDSYSSAETKRATFPSRFPFHHPSVVHLYVYRSPRLIDSPLSPCRPHFCPPRPGFFSQAWI